MRKKLTIILFIIAVSICCVMIYSFLKPNSFYEKYYKIGGGYDKLAADHTTIYVPPNVATNAKESLGNFEPTRQLATKLFNYEYLDLPPISFFVMVPGNIGYHRVQNVTGKYLPDRGVVLLNGERALFGTIIHEYSHFLFDLYLKDKGLAIEKLPVWLVEGLAEYTAFQIEHALPVASYDYNVLSLEQLNAWDSNNTNTVNLQGFYMVYELIENHGEDIIVQLINTYKNTNNFKASFEKVTGESFNHYHEKFQVDIDKIKDLDGKEADVMLQKGKELLENKASINQYTPIVLPILVSVSLYLEDINSAKEYFTELDRILFDPNDYLAFAQGFINAGEEAFAKQIIEKGLKVAQQFVYDIESYENEAKEILETTLP